MEEQPKGFEIALDDREHLVKVALWGEWNSDTAERFEHAFRQKLDKQSAKGNNAWCLLMDLTRFPSQTDDIEHVLTDVLVLAKQEGMKEKAVLAKKAVMPFQPEVFLQYPELKVHFFFHTETEAMRWLRNATARRR